MEVRWPLVVIVVAEAVNVAESVVGVELKLRRRPRVLQAGFGVDLPPPFDYLDLRLQLQQLQLGYSAAAVVVDAADDGELLPQPQSVRPPF